MKTLKMIAAAGALALGSGAASAASVVDLIVEGGGTPQVFSLENGRFLGLWGFDNRNNESPVTINNADDIIGGFTSGGSNIVGFFNGTNPINAGASEFDSLGYSFTIAADTRLFDSLWIEWTGGNLVYSFNGNSRTMGDGNITREGDPFSPATPIPLPAAGWLLLAAFGGLGVAARRKARANA